MARTQAPGLPGARHSAGGPRPPRESGSDRFAAESGPERHIAGLAAPQKCCGGPSAEHSALLDTAIQELFTSGLTFTLHAREATLPTVTRLALERYVRHLEKTILTLQRIALESEAASPPAPQLGERSPQFSAERSLLPSGKLLSSR